MPHKFTKDEMSRGGKRSALVRLNTNQVMKALNQYLSGELEGRDVLSDIASLTPLQRLQFLSSVLPYVMPKLASIEQHIETEVIELSQEEKIAKLKDLHRIAELIEAKKSKK